MAYESLLYALLFNLHPDKTLSWLRATLDMQMDRETSISEEQRLRALAKEVFNEWSGEKDLGQELRQRASSLMHHTVESLAAEAGLEPWQLLPEELVKAVEAAEGDFDSAIKLTSLLSRFGSTGADKQLVKKNESGLPWTGEYGGLFHEEWLDFWSMILLYLVHRMTEFAFETFEPSDKETKESYQGWHQAVKTAS